MKDVGLAQSSVRSECGSSTTALLSLPMTGAAPTPTQTFVTAFA